MIQNLSPEDAVGPIVAIVLMLILWQGFKTWRTYIKSKADITKEEYQDLVTQLRKQQDVTSIQMSEILSELAELKESTQKMERILREVE
jgi:predicted negative regulator of RcsB-dependent stress response